MSKRLVFEIKGKCLFLDTKKGRTCGTPTSGATFCDRHQAERDRLNEIMGEPTPLQLPRKAGKQAL